MSGEKKRYTTTCEEFYDFICDEDTCEEFNVDTACDRLNALTDGDNVFRQQPRHTEGKHLLAVVAQDVFRFINTTPANLGNVQKVQNLALKPERQAADFADAILGRGSLDP